MLVCGGPVEQIGVPSMATCFPGGFLRAVITSQRGLWMGRLDSYGVPNLDEPLLDGKALLTGAGQANKLNIRTPTVPHSRLPVVLPKGW